MKLSVALCTYNGKQFIEEQISSILNQTHKVDEIVVCDDCSTDGTVDAVRHIAKCNLNINIRVLVNDKNIGVRANFEKAVHECYGDIIFLSDQDDVWKPNKVETIVDWFRKNPDKSVVFTDANLIDSDGKLLDATDTLWCHVGFSPKIQKQFDNGYSFEIVANRYRCTGATMALRKDFVFDFSNYCRSGIYLDATIALVASLHNKLGYIPAKLIDYRIHEKQNAGINIEKEIYADKYQIHSIGKQFLNIEMTTKERKRLDFFMLRSDIPKKAIIRFGSYLCVYGFDAFSFWWSDFKRLASQVLKLSENK